MDENGPVYDKETDDWMLAKISARGIDMKTTLALHFEEVEEESKPRAKLSKVCNYWDGLRFPNRDLRWKVLAIYGHLRQLRTKMIDDIHEMR